MSSSSLSFPSFVSLLSALDALAARSTGTTFLLFVVGAHGALAAGGVCVALVFAVALKFDLFSAGHILVHLALLRSKSDSGSLKSRLGHGLGEGNLEHDVQVTEFVALLVEGQTLVKHSLNVIGLDNFARLVLDAQLGSIEVVDDEVDTSESLQESDFFLHEQIGALALEAFVGLLFHNDDHIAGLATRVLVGLTMESVLLVVRRALINLSLQNFLLLLDLLTIAVLALVSFINDLTSATAFIARASRLRVHAGTEHYHFVDHTTTIAS